MPKFFITNPPLFQNNWVSKNFQHKRGVYRVPKNSPGELFCLSKNYWYGKKLGMRKGAGVSCFSVGNFLSHSVEKHQGEPFSVSEKLGFLKVFRIIGTYHDFPSKFFSLTILKNFVGEPFCVSKIFGKENFNS